MSSAWRITIAGAGAIGCTLAARLAQVGHDVSVLARGATLAALRADGVRLDDLAGPQHAKVQADSEPVFGVQDLLFLCSKVQDLPALAAQVQPLIGPHTLIVPVCNGVPFWYFHREGGRFDGQGVEAVDPGGRLRALLPLDQVIGAVTFFTAEAVAPARVVARNPHLLMLGELGSREGEPPSERLAALCALINATGIEARALPRLRDKLWTKLIANLTSNPLSVVSGATLDAIYTRPDLLTTVREVMHEVMLVACCYGARLEIDPIEFVRLGAEMGPVRTSMLQDHQRGRPLELAAIGDAVLELAARYALPMPATRALLARARAAAWPAPPRSTPSTHFEPAAP